MNGYIGKYPPPAFPTFPTPTEPFNPYDLITFFNRNTISQNSGSWITVVEVNGKGILKKAIARTGGYNVQIRVTLDGAIISDCLGAGSVCGGFVADDCITGGAGGTTNYAGVHGITNIEQMIMRDGNSFVTNGQLDATNISVTPMYFRTSCKVEMRITNGVSSIYPFVLGGYK